jgi:DNA-binding CsgD family transcriptional regulator
LYHAGTQNWKVAQDKQGILYFANQEGLLSFDGSKWRLYTLPNETKVMSVAIGNDDRIYVGSQNELGYFSPSGGGGLIYISLNPLIPKDQLEFTEVWDIVPVGNQVFFRSNRRIFQYGDGRIAVYKSIDWNFLGFSNNQLLAHDFKAGFLSFENGYWTPFMVKGNLPKEAKITAFIPLNKDSSLIVSLKHGLFILSHNVVTAFESPDIADICIKNVQSALAIDRNTIALATTLGGCFIINYDGKIIRRLSKQDGVQNNNILALFMDRDRNLWMGLHNGIDFVAYNNPIKHIFPDNQEHSSGYTSLIYNNALYLGTSYGLYKADLTDQEDISYIKKDFQFIPDSKGQVWTLANVNGQLLMGHNEGAFIIRDNKALSLDSTSGFWNFQTLDNILPSPVMVSGTYNGVNFYNYENGKFINKNLHSHFESARSVIIDNGIIWVIHPFKGLYMVNYNSTKPTYTMYKDSGGILSKKKNFLFRVKNRLVISNDKGIFEYDEKKGVFLKSEFFYKLFGDARVQYLKEDTKGNIWFIQSKKLGVVDFSESVPQVVSLPELDNKIMGGNHEFIYPYNENNIFIAGEEGFYVVDYKSYKTRHENVTVLLRNVKSIGKTSTTYFDGYFLGKDSSVSNSTKDEKDISYSSNSLHFEFSSPSYSQQATVEYSYFLDGFDEHWSEWSYKNEKDYTNLSPGSYTFQVKARTHEGNVSEAKSYYFTVLPPWYRTVWAYIAYVLIALSVIYFLSKWQRNKFKLQQQKHEEDQQRIRYLHQLELERTENEIIRLKNEKLETEIQLKNAELAATAMNLMQKGEMLAKIKGEVIRIKKSTDNSHAEEDYKKIIRMLEENKTKRDWDTFAQHFDKVHSDFLMALKERYPNLTSGESKLCAYLRLNLTSKEISQLMSITLKSVELSRCRLRKKLNLHSDTNLVNFLSTFHSDVNVVRSKQDV